MFVAGTSALLAVEARLEEAELNVLRRSAEEYCTIPNHPRAFDGSWDECFDVNDDLEKLEELAAGKPSIHAPADSKGK